MADDQPLLELMVEAGFSKVFIGIETPDEDCLAECSKIQNRNRNLVEDVKRLQRAGLQVMGGFIVGFDHDRPSIFRKQIEFIQNSGIVTAMVGLLQAPPGTRLYERMKQGRPPPRGRLRRQRGRHHEHHSGDESGHSARRLQKTLAAHLFPEQYYRRIRTFLREYKPPRMRGRIRLSHILALLRSFYRLGLVGQGRFHYWKLLLWTQFRRPRLIPEAVVLAICGYHFRKVCERHVM